MPCFYLNKYIHVLDVHYELGVLMRMKIEEPSKPAFQNSTGICKQAMGARI
jgi:hypothetical protein